MSDIPYQGSRPYRYLALTSYLALLVWVLTWNFVFGRELTYSPLFTFISLVVPLLLPARGMLKGTPYTHAWANFVVLFYVIHGITIFYSNPSERWYAAIELVLSTGMFVGCSVFARLRGRELGLGLNKLKDEMAAEKARFEKR